MIKFKNYFEMLVPSTKSKNSDYISNSGERFLTTIRDIVRIFGLGRRHKHFKVIFKLNHLYHLL